MRSPNHPAGTRPFIPLFWRWFVPVLGIRDDGRGIDPEPPGQAGLRFMRERAISMGADLQIAARGSSGATEVRLRLPTEGKPR